jgi:outer membrane lipopolysaccharide assembly protein LptE/RlpB
MELNKWIRGWLAAGMVLLLQACSVSFTFNGASIDYTKVKSISVADFNNVAELIHPPLAQEFSEKVRDKYAKQTRLKVLKANGDMQLEGEIVGYTLTPMSIGQDSYSAETKLTLTVNVRFVNTKNPEENLEDKQYSAFRTFDSNLMITEVQDQLLAEMIEDIADNIYNDTVARW